MEEKQIYPLPSRAWLDVDLVALRHNASVLARSAGVPLIPMVKADAYGVGAAAVVAALEPMDPWGYGVATTAEGQSLRDIGVARPVVVFTPILASDFDAARTADLIPTLSSGELIREWGRSRRPYHLSIDTGMNRAGVCWRDVEGIAEAVREFPPAGACTHFHSAELNDGSAAVQEERFHTAVRRLGVDIPLLHTANSAAIARGCGGRWGAVRPGVFLYGVGSGESAPVSPKPVVHFRARVVETRWLEPGDSVSYDATYVAQHHTRIATIAAGYGDGYPRALSNRGAAILNGVRIPVRGLVTMDMTMFDITDVRCEVGDVVTLVGSDGANLITVEDVARTAEMSPYELLTGLGRRLERRYRSEDKAV